MSELIQKLLDIGGCDAETEWAKGYDDGVNAAINVVEEYSKQPTLNENQQIVLEWLKKMHQPKLKVSAMVNVFCLVDDNINDNWQEYNEEIPPHIEALQELSIQEENQVLQAFASWAIDQC